MNIQWRIGAALTLAGLAGAGHAQQASSVPALGSGFATREVNVGAYGRLSYDTNVLRGRGLRSGQDGLEASGGRGDFIFSTGLSGGIVLPISRQAVFLNGSAGYNFYRRNSRLNRENIDLTGGANLRAGTRCSATPSIGYSRGLSDLGDTLTVTGNTNTQQTVSYGADVNCAGVTGLAVGGGYRRSTTRNSSDLRRLLNVNTETFNANVGLTSPSLGTVSVYGTYLKGRYPNRVAIDSSGAIVPDDGIDSYSGGLLYQRQFGAAITGSASIGVTKVKPRTAGVDGFTGLSYSVNMSYVRDPLSIAITGARQAGQSNLIVSAYSINTSLNIDASYALNSRLRLNGSAGVARRSFQPTTLAAVPGLPLLGNGFRSDDTTYNGSAGVGYTLSRRISLDAGVQHQRRSAQNGIFSFNSTRVSVGGRVRL